MPDRSDRRPERWWVLNPTGHGLSICGVCKKPIPTDNSIPMFEDMPVCAEDATKLLRLKDTPVTAEYARWIDEGDPRWWSAWICNCSYCNAEEILG